MPISVLIDGLIYGLQLGLLGVGLTLVYGLGGVLNLAHGQIAVLAAITIAVLMKAGVPTVGAVALGLLVVIVLGVLLDLTIMKPVYRLQGEQRVLLGLLLMLGVGFIIEGFLNWRYPIEALTIRLEGEPVSVLGAAVPFGSVVASLITLTVAATLTAFFRLTTVGRAVRSVIQNEDGARLCGINPAAARTFIFGLSAGLAGLMAVTRSMTSPISVSLGISLTILALIVAVVGGLGSVAGAFVAGILLGVVHAVSSYQIGSYITTIVLLVAAALTILIRPSGLLGTPHGGGGHG